MFTTAFRDTCLGQLGGFIGLLTAIADWRGASVTEATYTGYGARPAVTWTTGPPYTAISGSPSPGRQRSNTAAVTFAQNTGANQDQIAFGVYSASSAGSLHAIGLLDTDPPLFGVVDPADAASDLIRCPAHGLQTDQRVFVLAAPGAIMPAAISENTAYFVLASGLTADVFKLATSSAGTALNLTTAGGAALFCPYKAVTVATNATPEFAINALVVQI